MPAPPRLLSACHFSGSKGSFEVNYSHHTFQRIISFSSCFVTFRMALDWVGFGYAALVASGGIIGYAKAGSVPSLAAGLFFGGLAGLGAYQLSQDPKNVWVSLAASGALAGVMGMRFYNSGKFMPAGLIAGASFLMVGRLGLRLLDKPSQS
uniref:Transmembrane protein 14C n=2 Tax=Ornithorhynchus anatinus TaxID=9258 RepID=A0A6I8N0A9_ORNAN